MKTMMKKTGRVCVVIGVGGLALGMVSGLGGCNMISGIGKDIQEMSENTKLFLEGKKRKAPVSQEKPKKSGGWWG